MGNQIAITVNVLDGLSLATLDILGHAAFGIDLRCFEDPNQEILKIYRGFL
jgi:hypothetical protein